MSTKTTAHSILWPTDLKIVVRVCFLYVGQGSSIVLLVRDGSTYRVLLVDSNLDKTNGGIDVPELTKSLVASDPLYAFVNTHPHNDHLRGLKELTEAVTIDNVWHSGHLPSKKHGTYHPDLLALIKDVEKRNGKDAVTELVGTRTEKAIFDATLLTMAPAKHVQDEVNEEDADARHRRIHENCTVFRIGKEPSWILITGDADLVAFRDNITDYHKERLSAFVLDAPHHGSRSFFVAKKDDDPYLDALETIASEYVVISAPTDDESPHDHPHADAVKLYAAQVTADNVLHTGDERESFFFDVYEDGTHSEKQTDSGKLAELYGLVPDDTDGGGNDRGSKSDKKGPFVRPTRPPVLKPQKYG